MQWPETTRNQCRQHLISLSLWGARRLFLFLSACIYSGRWVSANMLYSSVWRRNSLLLLLLSNLASLSNFRLFVLAIQLALRNTVYLSCAKRLFAWCSKKPLVDGCLTTQQQRGLKVIKIAPNGKRKFSSKQFIFHIGECYCI